MALTTAQMQAIKAYIVADNTLNAQPNTNAGNSVIAGVLNAIASPTFTVWRTNVTQDEIMQNGFDWVQVDNLSVGKARIWEWLFNNSGRSMNPAKANVRAGIAECWKGTAAMLAVRAAVLAHCKHASNVLEKILASGTGSDADPATMGYEGTITPDEIEQARSLP